MPSPYRSGFEVEVQGLELSSAAHMPTAHVSTNGCEALSAISNLLFQFPSAIEIDNGPNKKKQIPAFPKF